MFVSFEVSNYGPFSGTVGISTQIDSSKKEFLEENTFTDGDKHYNLVNYIYGYNGSGKSHIFKALLTMQQIITLSPIIATNNQQILEDTPIRYDVSEQRNFFKFKEGFNSIPTKYSIEIKIDGTLYSYSFEVLDKKIVKETLYKKLKPKEVLINRTSERSEDIIVKGELKSFANFRSTVKDNVLCLSMAMFLNNELAVKIFNEINSIVVVNMTSFISNEYFEDLQDDELTLYSKYLRLADNTIKKLNVLLEKKESNKDIQLGKDFESRRFIIKDLTVDIDSIHNIYNKDNKIVGEEHLPFFKYESNGTIKMFGVLPAIFRTLKKGATIFIDEIENGLHPKLTDLLISLFYSSETNPNNAQLICSSHNVLLLKEGIRRDQVWFLHKNKYGESKIKRLSQFPGTRTTDNVARKYLDGAFGEVPHL